MYRDSIPGELRDIGELGLSTMEDYISFSNTLHDQYDTVTMDDGTKYGKVYDLKNDDDISLEDMRTSDTKEIEAGTNESALEREVPNLVDIEGNLEEKHRIDIDNENQKDESALKRSGDVMVGTAVGMAVAGAVSEQLQETSDELSEMLKTPSVEADTKVKDINKPKVLRLNDNKNTNDNSYKQAGMAMSDSLLLIIFMIVFIIFIGVIYFFTK